MTMFNTRDTTRSHPGTINTTVTPARERPKYSFTSHGLQVNSELSDTIASRPLRPYTDFSRSAAILAWAFTGS